MRTYVLDGVANIEYAPDAFERARQWTVDTVVLATYGGPTAGVEFEIPKPFFGHPAFLGDGRLAVAGGSASLVIYTADGRGERVIGRRGRGPAELSQVTGVIAGAGDTLVVPDFVNARVNWITADGRFVRERSAPFIAGRMIFPRPIGTLPDGGIVLFALQALRAGAVDSIVRRPVPLAVLRPEPGELEVIATPPGPELARPRVRGGRSANMEVRFGRASHAIVWDTLIAVAEGDAYTVDLRTSRGDVVARLRVPIVRRPILAAIRDSIIAGELERATARAAAEGGRSLAQLQELIRVQRFADSLPPYAGLYTSRDGLLWVLDPIGPMDSSWTATAFQRDYTIAARIRGPGRRAPVAFGADRVILAHVDEAGFEIWRAYALIR